MRYVKAVLFTIATLLLAVAFAQPAQADLSFDVAYSSLSHHGSWLVSAQYGRVWQPREYNRDWNPYYDGHWVYTDMGWAWVSDYEWGAIPYHYGTWVADRHAGWVWIPGRVWAPAWVVFRTGHDCIGWAPVPPGYSVGIRSMDMGGPSSFVFVYSRDFLAPRVRTSIIPGDRVNIIIKNTTVVNNITIQNNVVVNRGPDHRFVERATGRPISAERIERVARVAPFESVSRAQLAFDSKQRAKRGLRAAEQVPASRALPGPGNRGAGARSTASAGATNPGNGRPASRPPTQERATRPEPARRPADSNQEARRAPAPPREPVAGSSVESKRRVEPQQNAQAPRDAKGKAYAKQTAKVKAKGAKAEAKAGKDPDKKGQGTDKEHAPETKDGAHQ